MVWTNKSGERIEKDWGYWKVDERIKRRYYLGGREFS